MRDERAFHFCCAHTVTRDIDDIINAARNPVKTVLIALTSITRKIITGIGGEIRIFETLMIAVNRPHLARPAIRDD